MKIRTNGTTLFYEKTGTGPPLILSHGNGEDHFIFDEITKALAGEFTVYRPDSRGHGQSLPVSELHYTDMAEDMAGFIRELRLEHPFFYGFSDGGIVGLLVACRYPELLSGLAVSGANLDPRGLKNYLYRLYRILYFFKRDTKIKMILTEPSITAADLRRIRIPTVVTAGQKDMIKEAHTRFIAEHIADSSLRIFAGETHGSYVVHSTKLFSMIKEAASAHSK